MQNGMKLDSVVRVINAIVRLLGLQ